MAAGTSSPELFTSLVAIAGPVADIGTGTVVGSGKFDSNFFVCKILTDFIHSNF